ncbi:MAG: FG-GAP-like repeat-containing protein [Phycisphaerales bacterium]
MPSRSNQPASRAPRRRAHAATAAAARSAGASASTAIVSFALGTPAIAQTIDFDWPVILGAGDSSRVSVVGDFTGDARHDIAVQVRDYPITELVIYRNDGDLEFTEIYREIISERWTSSLMAAGDFDGDDDLDLLWLDSISYRETSFEFFLNHGDGSSGARHTLPGPETVGGLAVGDLDDDGDLDFAYTSEGAVVAAFNEGDLNFRNEEIYFDGDSSSGHLAIGDIDGDGDKDIAASIFYGYYYRWWNLYWSNLVSVENEGGGVFTNASVVEIDWNRGWNIYPTEVRFGDVDGDGDLDAFVGGSQMDGDEYPTEIALLQCDSGVEFTQTHILLYGHGQGANLDLGDFDLDGRIDCAAMSSDRGVYVWSNRAIRNQLPPLPFPTNVSRFAFFTGEPVHAVDLTDDGFADLVTSGQDGISILRNISRFDGPVLAQTALERGEPATFTVSGVEPGERVFLLASTVGYGLTAGVAPLGGLTLDLLEPTQVASRLANPAGVATISGVIDSNFPADALTTQAIVRRGARGRDSVKTPFITAPVAP